MPSFLPIAAFHPRMICVLWGHSSHPLWLITFSGGWRERKKPLEWQLKKAILAAGLVLRCFKNPHRVSPWWQIWSGTSGQYTPTRSFTYCRLRNLCTVERSAFPKETLHSNMTEIKFKVKYRLFWGLELQWQKSTFSSRFSWRTASCLCLYNQADFIVFKINGIATF